MPDPKKEKDTARILEIQRMSTEDGPGIRTTIFLKGCSLRCTWCHNPESISPKPQVHWIDSRCIGCRTCLEVCPNQSLSMTDEGIVIDRENCTGCGACADECPATALELLGRLWSLEDLVNEAVKDQAFFETSDGGITVSGGEPGLQAEFVGHFLAELKKRGIHTALDTCGGYRPETLDHLLPHADLVLFDLKESDPDKHMEFTGFKQQTIFDNLIYICKTIRSTGHPAELWIRTPIIPDATARPDNIRGIGRFIADHADGRVARWELCAFNHLCRDKYKRLGREWIFADHGLLKRSVMEMLARVARDSGVDPAIVHWSGSTLDETEEEEKKGNVRVMRKAC